MFWCYEMPCFTCKMSIILVPRVDCRIWCRVLQSMFVSVCLLVERSLPYISWTSLSSALPALKRCVVFCIVQSLAPKEMWFQTCFDDAGLASDNVFFAFFSCLHALWTENTLRFQIIFEDQEWCWTDAAFQADFQQMGSIPYMSSRQDPLATLVARQKQMSLEQFEELEVLGQVCP